MLDTLPSTGTTPKPSAATTGRLADDFKALKAAYARCEVDERGRPIQPRNGARPPAETRKPWPVRLFGWLAVCTDWRQPKALALFQVAVAAVSVGFKWLYFVAPKPYSFWREAIGWTPVLGFAAGLASAWWVDGWWVVAACCGLTACGWWLRQVGPTRYRDRLAACDRCDSGGLVEGRGTCKKGMGCNGKCGNWFMNTIRVRARFRGATCPAEEWDKPPATVENAGKPVRITTENITGDAQPVAPGP